ncbi:MAG TPA: outer membrane beta-barrel protein [Chitinophagaceae bacterium]|nr:outer membrane beta-barrel protein [Chitinophagaceae bacterium]
MKKILLNLVLSVWLLQIQANSQELKKISFDLTVSLGNSILVNMLTGTDQLLSPYSQTNLFINIPFQKQVFLSTGIGYESNRHLVDGRFLKSQDQYDYQQAPPDYTQNEILLDYINIPVFIKNNFGKSEAQDLNIGIGPTIGYLVDSKQKAKISGNEITTEAPVENKFRYGINLDFDLKRKFGKNKMKGVFGWGLYYQLSKNVSESKSFVPLTAYIRFGIGI